MTVLMSNLSDVEIHTGFNANVGQVGQKSSRPASIFTVKIVLLISESKETLSLNVCQSKTQRYSV